MNSDTMPTGTDEASENDADVKVTPAVRERFLAPWRVLSRLQALVLWATAVIIILAVMYPTTVLSNWNGEQWANETPERMASYANEFPWVHEIGQRKLRVAMSQWSETHNESNRRHDFKMDPDYDRMKLEVGMALFIGIGLVIALRRSPK